MIHAGAVGLLPSNTVYRVHIPLSSPELTTCKFPKQFVPIQNEDCHVNRAIVQHRRKLWMLDLDRDFYQQENASS
jgi:hypothetical protein